MRRVLPVCLFLLAAADAMAGVGSWHVPHPWRADAAVEGRRIDYGDERFLHLFSYEHAVDAPGPVGQGVRGTGGSVDSDTLYYDFRFLRDFAFDNGATAGVLDVQRSEDFDGAFDRQIFGLRHDLNDDWGLSLRGDVLAEKSGSDVYLGVHRYLSGDGWLQAQWVLADAYLNEKTIDDAEFTDQPVTTFIQWHQPRDNGHTTISLNLSPKSTLVDRDQGVMVSSEQVRLGVQHWFGSPEQQWRISANGERTRRLHTLAEIPGRQGFARDFAEATLSSHFNTVEGRPWLGIRYLWLHERGWFGRAVNDNGRVMRKEPMGFAGMHLDIGEHSTLAPTVYISRARVEQEAVGDWSARDEDAWIGKLSLPWHLTVDAATGAVVTVSPSFRLHRFAFGGGNVQFHWPL